MFQVLKWKNGYSEQDGEYQQIKLKLYKKLKYYYGEIQYLKWSDQFISWV